MRIVCVYNWSVPYEADGEETKPLEYESIEAAKVDFEKALRAYVENIKTFEGEMDTLLDRHPGHFSFAGFGFLPRDFWHNNEVFLPEFLTVDEWFEKYGVLNESVG